mgnify:CR=1 FL=1
MDIDKIFTAGIDYVAREPVMKWSSEPVTRESMIEDLIGGLRVFAESEGIDAAAVEARLAEMRVTLDAGPVRVPAALLAGGWDAPPQGPAEDFAAVEEAAADDAAWRAKNHPL